MGLALLPSWAGPSASRVPANVLVIGKVISDAVSLDPAQSFEPTSLWVGNQIYETLVDLSRDFTRATPRLAESWTVSPDGRTYTFKVRGGVKFHSGATVDNRAVEFSLRRAMRLRLSPSFILTDFIRSPDDIQAVGRDQVRVTFGQVMPEVLMASVLSFNVASIVDQALVQRNATADDPLANKWLSDQDAGSGPFRLIGWSRNLKIELQAFDDYWRGRPKMGRIYIQDTPEPTAELLALRNGDIDAAMQLLPVHYKELANVPGFVVKTTTQFRPRYLAMNAGYAPFANKDVRNAVKWAVDYDAIKRLHEDAIEIGQTIIPARMFGHLPDKPYRRNVDRAKALMREAGFERGFRVELLVAAEPVLPDVAAKIKEDLAQIGIDVQVNLLRFAELVGAYRMGRHQMVLLQWTADYPDPDNLAKGFADFDVRQLAWRNQWDHPVKQLVKQAVRELDRSKREAMYREIQKVMLEEGPFVIFGYTMWQIAMRPNVKGVEPSPLLATYDLFDSFKE